MTSQSQAKSLARLEHMASRLAAQVEEYAELDQGHPDVVRLCASNMHNMENLPAIRAGIVGIKYSGRGPELLSQLVAAIRAQRAARTTREVAEARALLDEAFEQAATLADNLEDA